MIIVLQTKLWNLNLTNYHSALAPTAKGVTASLIANAMLARPNVSAIDIFFSESQAC
jgi:hypothetical protein